MVLLDWLFFSGDKGIYLLQGAAQLFNYIHEIHKKHEQKRRD
jgi:hypothetical protein